MRAVLAACSTVQSKSARLLRLGLMVEPMRRTSSPYDIGAKAFSTSVRLNSGPPHNIPASPE
ncbi:hypothetical protein ACE1SV_43380 [Streptomyces sp. E-15]